MTRWITRSDATQATVLSSLGALLLFGAIPFPLGAPLIAVALVVLAILVFTGTIDGPGWLAASLMGVALLLLIANPVGRWLDGVLVIGLPVLAGGVLVALGVLKLAAPIEPWQAPDSMST